MRAGPEPEHFQPLPTSGDSTFHLNHLYQYTNGTLFLQNLQKTDSGWYQCEADNGVSPALADHVSIVVQGESEVSQGRVVIPKQYRLVIIKSGIYSHYNKPISFWKLPIEL